MFVKEYKRNKFPHIAMRIDESEAPLTTKKIYVSMC